MLQNNDLSYNQIFGVSKFIISTMVKQAQTCYPKECCGLLAGEDFTFTQCYPLANVAQNPFQQFFVEPSALVELMLRFYNTKTRLWGIYHSHPHTPFPSLTDRNQALYPDAIYFIIAQFPQWEIQAYQLQDAQFINIPFITV
jgi:[CysO sulfur-carrier protein]-S-L-cysteine hydrolase